MAGSVVYSLRGIRSPVGLATESLDQFITVKVTAGNEALFRILKHGTLQLIPDGVVEETKTRNHVGISLDGHLYIGFGDAGGHIPALAVEDHIGMGLVNLGDQLIDGVGVNETHQIEAETVDMIFISPVFNGVHDVLSDHAPLRGGIVAAAGGVDQCAVAVETAEVHGNDLVEAEVISLINMVVHHVHNHTQTSVVQSLDHLLCFLHANSTVVRVGGIRALRNVEVNRVITPVVLGQGKGLVGETVVVHGQNMHMGDTQRLDVIQTGGDAALGLGAFLDHTQILALVNNSGTFVSRQVTDMQLVNHSIGDGLAGIGVAVFCPILGIGGVQIDDHSALAIDAGGSGVGIAGLHGLSVNSNEIGVVYAVQIAILAGNPSAVHVGGHLDLLDQILGAGGTGLVKAQLDGLSGRRPDPEIGLISGPNSTQIGAGIGVAGLKFVCRIEIMHHDVKLL